MRPEEHNHSADQKIEVIRNRFSLLDDVAQTDRMIGDLLKSQSMPNVIMGTLNKSTYKEPFDFSEFSEEIKTLNLDDFTLYEDLTCAPIAIDVTDKQAHPLTVLVENVEESSVTSTRIYMANIDLQAEFGAVRDIAQAQFDALKQRAMNVTHLLG